MRSSFLGLRVRVFGAAMVAWSLKPTRAFSRQKKWIREKEVYFDETFNLWQEDGDALQSS